MINVKRLLKNTGAAAVGAALAYIVGAPELGTYAAVVGTVLTAVFKAQRLAHPKAWFWQLL